MTRGRTRRRRRRRRKGIKGGRIKIKRANVGERREDPYVVETDLLRRNVIHVPNSVPEKKNAFRRGPFNISASTHIYQSAIWMRCRRCGYLWLHLNIYCT
jgi:hypothetical protein